jgi:hypothetical protein
MLNMDDKQFEQQMKLLKKSYERVPSKFNSEEVLKKIEEEGKQQQNMLVVEPRKTSKWQKISVWPVSLASVFLIGILSASFLNDGNGQGSEEPEPSSQYELKIKEMKEKYLAARDKRQEMLKMDDEQFDQLGFVSGADQYMSFLLDERNLEEGIISFPIDQQYERVLDELKLPSEMVDEASQGEKLNMQESMAFIDSLNNKLNDLKLSYNELIKKHEEILKTAKFGGQLSFDMLYSSRDKFPEEVRNMLGVAPKQGITLQPTITDETFEAQFQVLKFNSALQPVLDEKAIAYLYIMEQSPFTYGGTLLPHPDEAAYLLLLMEEILLETDEVFHVYQTTKAMYEDLAYQLIFGASNTSVFDEHRVVKQEYQMAWQSLSLSSGLSPIAHFLRPLVQSMESNGWKENETYKNLQFTDLQDSFTLAKDGNLAMGMSGNEMNFMEETIILPDKEYGNRVNDLYREFSGNFDENILKGATALEIIGLMETAHAHDDMNTMMRLFEQNADFPTIESFKKFLDSYWTLNPQVAELAFRNDQTFYNGDGYNTLIQVSSNFNGGKMLETIEMVRGQDSIWRFPYRQSSSAGEENAVIDETVIDMEFMSRVHGLYKTFATDKNQETLKGVPPTEIVGLWFYSAELGDFETQYALYIQGEEHLVIPKEEYLRDVSNENQPSFEEKYSAISFEFDDPGHFTGLAKLKVDKEEFPDEEEWKGFKMIQTDSGWRVAFMPMQ